VLLSIPTDIRRKSTGIYYHTCNALRLCFLGIMGVVFPPPAIMRRKEKSYLHLNCRRCTQRKGKSSIIIVIAENNSTMQQQTQTSCIIQSSIQQMCSLDYSPTVWCVCGFAHRISSMFRKSLRDILLLLALPLIVLSRNLAQYIVEGCTGVGCRARRSWNRARRSGNARVALLRLQRQWRCIHHTRARS
jgi:hypothetical protein